MPKIVRTQARLRSADRVLGWLHVELSTGSEVDGSKRSLWGGRILGSDYLVWGANHQKLWLDLDDETSAEVVVRATGELRGLGPVPPLLLRRMT